jgi:hypothetical protein
MRGCRGSHPEDERPAADVGLLCRKCHDLLRKQLRMLPAVENWLRANLRAGSGELRDKVSGSSEDPIPLRLNVLDMIGPTSPLPVFRFVLDQEGREAIRSIFRRYAEKVHEDGGHPYPPSAIVFRDGTPLGEYSSFEDAVRDCDQARWDSRRSTDPRRWSIRQRVSREGWPERAPLADVSKYLGNHLKWVVHQDWCEELLGELTHLLSEAHQSTPWREEIRRDTEPCRRCKKPTVVLHIAQAKSRCEEKAGGCGRSEPLSEYVMNALLPETRK